MLKICLYTVKIIDVILSAANMVMPNFSITMANYFKLGNNLNEVAALYIGRFVILAHDL